MSTPPPSAEPGGHWTERTRAPGPADRPPGRPTPAPTVGDHRSGTAQTAPSQSAAKSPFVALCSLLIRTQVTRLRVTCLALLGLLSILVGWAYGSGRSGTQVVKVTEFINNFGISLLVPVVALVFASSMFGDPSDDKTLVYLWLRPIPRWQLTTAAALTSLLVAWPLAVPPLAVAAAVSHGGKDLVAGTVLSATIGLVAYTGAFVALGVRVRWPLVWGLLYIIIWEGFVSRGGGAKNLAVRSYDSSILGYYTNVALEPGGFGLALAVGVPLALGVAGVVYATWRLGRQDVA